MMVITMLADSAQTLAAQSVAQGPQTAAQPSFNGHGWLVVVNLALMTACALTAAMAVGKLVRELLLERRGPLVKLLRILMLVTFGGMMLRTGAEAVTLWGWDPFEPEKTGWYMTLKRFIDPFGAGAYYISICMFIMTEDALTASLDRKPFPARLTSALPKLRRPAALAVLTIVAAIGVVSLR